MARGFDLMNRFDIALGALLFVVVARKLFARMMTRLAVYKCSGSGRHNDQGALS